MTHYAFRTLVQNKLRFLLSISGVALALSLILIFDAIITGVEGRLSAYIDHSGADIWVAQAGVQNLHMVSSELPASVTSQVQAVPGVAAVTPILYVTDALVIERTQDRSGVYLIGLPPDAKMGGPWDIAQGISIPGSGQAVIDESIAQKAGVGLGDRVTLLGQSFRIAGLARGTTNLLTSVAFISLQDFARIAGNQQAVSFVLVKISPGVSASTVAVRIEQRVQGVTALPRAAFAVQERKLVKDMASDMITIMNWAGFLVGLAVLALIVYTATLARRQEYGMLKALGVRNQQLYGAVVSQAVSCTVLGLLLAVTLTVGLSDIVPSVQPTLVLEISALSLLKVVAISLAITVLAALLPIKQIAGLDPAMVFKGA